MYNTKTKQAQQFLYSHMDVGKDLQQPKVLIHVLNKLIDQYSSSLPLILTRTSFTPGCMVLERV